MLRPYGIDPAPVGGPRRLLHLARLSVAWEWLWPRLWPLVAAAGVFAAVTLFDVLPRLPGWLHIVVLVVLAGAAVATVVRAVLGYRLPALTVARRRLERDSGLDHRPLTALADRQVTSVRDPEARALWKAHLDRQRAAASRLRLRLPRPGLAERDRYGLRGLLALTVLIAAVVSWGDWGPRLVRAMSPQFAAAGPATVPVLDLFISPPRYTGVAPFYLVPPVADEATGELPPGPAIAAPVDSVLAARVSGGDGVPVLRVGEQGVPFDRVAADSAEVEVTLTAGDRIAVELDGRQLAEWPLELIPDAAPVIDFAEPPAATERGALRLHYSATDDYGIAAVTATLALDSDAPAALPRDPVVLDLTVPGLQPAEAEGIGFEDLTPHPWAGQPVTILLSAVDGRGQTGVSAPVDMVLPEREFHHPIARAIIDQRRTLLLHPEDYVVVAETLETLSLRPDRYYDDAVVFLALRTAGRRLMLAHDAATAVTPVQQLLWDTALRLEDGDLSLAERDLRDAQQALMDALSRDASDEEIAQLMDQLREAMDRYLEALEQNLLERLARGEELQPMMVPPDANTISRQQLDDMLQRMQELSESGARDAARQMLSQLQDMLENLETGMAAQQQQQQSQMMSLLEDLQALMQAQQDLLDQTFQQSQQGDGPSRPGQQPGAMPQDGDGAAVQEGLRRALGELMREMGEFAGSIPAPFGRAEQSMRRSTDALGRGRPDEAIDPQTETLDALQQGLQSFVDQMLEQMAQQSGTPVGASGQPLRGNTDPLGRPLDNAGGISTEDVAIPEEAELQRSREILRELRRRLGERQRPQLERDYIERLLRRF